MCFLNKINKKMSKYKSDLGKNNDNGKIVHIEQQQQQ